MKLLHAFVVASLVAPAALAAPPSGRAHGLHANPAFHPIRRRLDGGNTPARVEQVGEVVILEGDMDLVSVDDQGNWGIAFDDTSQQPPNITTRFFTEYPDQFDEIFVFTSFDDTQDAGLAYEVSTQQDVKGLGDDRFDDSADWGAQDGRLHAFVDMDRWDLYAGLDGLDPADPRSGGYSTMGQEFAHRWLAFLAFKDAGGKNSLSMLGRDQAHWSALLQADASLMDGVAWTDHGDGTFSAGGSDLRYSALDLYGMGVVDASDVAPWYLIQNGVYSDGTKVQSADAIYPGTRISGTRVDITIDQVIAANGARVPSAASSPHGYRVAFVLLTHPGERASDVIEAARRLDQMRKTWESTFATYTGGKATMCTRVSAPCDQPGVAFDAGSVAEAGGNGDGVVEPGEPVSVTFKATNDGTVAVSAVPVTATGALGLSPATAMIGSLASGDATTLTYAGAVAKDAACGAPMVVEASASVGNNTAHGFAEVVPGLADLAREDFEQGDAGYAASGGTKNGWEYGQPKQYGDGYSINQPGAGHSGKKGWFTGLKSSNGFSSSLQGTSVLVSPPYDVSRGYRPSLRYWVWDVGYDFSDPQNPALSTATNLTVEGSIDGGASWLPIDSVTTAYDAGWHRRDVELGDKFASAKTLILRFTAENDEPRSLVEIGVDDVELRGLVGACNPNVAAMMAASGDGCGCSVGARPSGTPGLLLLALLLGAVVGLRRVRGRVRTSM